MSLQTRYHKDNIINYYVIINCEAIDKRQQRFSFANAQCTVISATLGVEKGTSVQDKLNSKRLRACDCRSFRKRKEKSNTLNMRDVRWKQLSQEIPKESCFKTPRCDEVRAWPP